ncbi:MAG: hypothetical protein JWR29_991 [Tardiphaga sp.]|nr:hypothetical protein [Tardiphaga sp.]
MPPLLLGWVVGRYASSPADVMPARAATRSSATSPLNISLAEDHHPHRG